MTIEKIDPRLLQEAGAKKKGFKAQGMDTSGFGAVLDTIGAMGPAAMTAGQMYGGTNSAAVLSAAFSGMGATSGQIGGGMGGTSGAPYLAGGFSGGFSGGYKSANFGIGDPNAPVVPGAEGMSQMDMINTMNQNNLQLLELQAVMQNNMQAWNTKSNILSADHRARMAMIEKYTAR